MILINSLFCFIFNNSENVIKIKSRFFFLSLILLNAVVDAERPKTPCEQHRDRAQGRGDALPVLGAFVPQCDEQGQYRSQQCHGSTGHCWCVDSSGRERAGTRTPPSTTPIDCDAPGKQIRSQNHNVKLILYMLL